MILTRISLVKFLSFIFLFLHAAPLIFNQYYQMIIIFNYSIVLLLLIVASFSNKKMSLLSILYIILIFISSSMSILGFSGTISALIMAASLPHFLFSIINLKEDFLKLFYQPIVLFSILLMVFSFYLYTDIKDMLNNYLYLGEYFVIASINYVPLVFASFSILLYLLVKTQLELFNNERLGWLLLLFLILLTIFYSSIFLTRSVLVCSLVLMYTYFKKTRILLLLALPIFVSYNIEVIIPIFVNFFGSSDILNILSDFSRTNSVISLINSSLENIFYNFDFRNQMSYSSLMNLLFSMFPLTFIFLYSPLNAFIKIFKSNDIIMILVFLSSFTLVLYQMDFFSIFVFYFLSEYIKTFLDNKYAS